MFMDDTEFLKAKAIEIKDQLKSGSDSVDLNKSLSESKNNESLPRSNSDENEPASQNNTQLRQDDRNSENESKKLRSYQSDNNSKQSKLAFFGGYKLADILESPLRQPTSISTENSSETANNRVILLVAIGVIIVCISLFLLIASYLDLGLAFLLLGAVIILIAVFAPIP
jgi:hypothetical protein